MASSATVNPSPKFVPLGFNMGAILGHLAGRYPTLFDTILELVQNAIDTDVQATRVDIYVNFATRRLTVRDNGNGTTEEQFNAALRTIADPNRKGKDALGQFGIGLVSPVGKCRQHTFTSCPVGQKTPYYQWVFDSAKLIASRDRLSVPMEERRDLVFGNVNSKTGQRLEWRSEMALDGFVKDDSISAISIDNLVHAIQDRFRVTMRRNRVKVNVIVVRPDGKKEERLNVSAPIFNGTPLEERVVSNSLAGRVKFTLFVPKDRKGKIVTGVLGNDFRFPMFYFLRSLEGQLDEEIIDALNSGFFEGEILAEKVTLLADRNSFAKDDAWISFAVAIEEWWKRWGEVLYSEVKQAKKSTRWQDIGTRAMSLLEKLFGDPKQAHLLGVVKGLKFGSVGVNHADVPEKKVKGEQSETSLAVGDDKGKTPNSPSGGRGPSGPGEKERPDHIPLSVFGGRGTKRTIVKSNSLGLQFDYQRLLASEVWSFDDQTGLLTYNIANELFVACDERSDAALTRFQQFVAIQVLTLYSLLPGDRMVLKRAFDRLIQAEVFLILNSDAKGARKPTTAKGKQKLPKKVFG